MKRISLLVGLSALLLLGACGSEEASTQSVEPKENPAVEDTKEVEPEEKIEEPEITELDVEVVEETTDPAAQRKLFRELYREIKDRFAVASYKDVKRKDLQNAIRYVDGWLPRKVS